MMSDYNTPDLASVLRTLAAYVPPGSPSGQHQYGTDQATSLTSENDFEEGEYILEEPAPSMPPAALSTNEPLRTFEKIPTSGLKRTIIDSNTITTWPAAIRYVTRTIAHDEVVTTRIKKLIAVQRQHELQWWEGREALIQKQKDRVEGRRKVDEVLKAVGGKVDASNSDPSPEENASELLRYDKKVHKACTEMVNATIGELKTLGIPFFALRKDLVLQDDDAHRDAYMHDDLERDGAGRLVEKKLRVEELQSLQKRAIELLEDLCND